MKTLVYAGPGKVEVQEKPFPELRPGQVRIKVHYCGICGSDIGIFSGKHPRAKAPLVLGHEFIGCDEDVLFKLDDGITDKAAAVIEPLAVIIRTMHQADF